MMFLRTAAAACLLTFAMALAGCGKGNKTVTVTGTVLRSGQPLALSPTGLVEVTLEPDVPPDKAFSPMLGECDKATGKFEIRDVPPGKYKVGVQQLDPNPTVDKLNGAFSARAGKIIRDIDGKTPLTIDLAQPDASK